ncbi:hypothetical protein, partial [Rhizobium mongolense]|uniref:hypothetical protein n=1 Tax=Rhizobium mongolense TaxID=57676 RepID=UPI0034A4E536
RKAKVEPYRVRNDLSGKADHEQLLTWPMYAHLHQPSVNFTVPMKQRDFAVATQAVISGSEARQLLER